MLLCFSAPFLFWQTDLPNKGTVGAPTFPLLAASSFLFDQSSHWPNKQLAFASFPCPYCFDCHRLPGMLNDWHPKQPGIPSAFVLLFWVLASQFDKQTNKGTVSIASPLFFFLCHLSWNKTWMLLCFSAPFLFQQTNLPNEGTTSKKVFRTCLCSGYVHVFFPDSIVWFHVVMIVSGN